MENQETTERDLEKIILKGGILEIESVLDQLINDIMQDDGIYKPVYILIFKDLMIKLKGELKSSSLNGIEKSYKKVQVNKLKELIQRLENQGEIDKYFQTLAEKETQLKEKNTTDELDQRNDKEIKNSSLDDSIETNSETKIKMDKLSNEIDELINIMDPNDGWEKVFFEKTDYDDYKKIIVEFFNNPNYNIPKKEIKIKPRTKTHIISIFKKLHNRYSKNKTGHMQNDIKLFEIVKILDLWSNDSNTQIYKSITRNYLN